MKILALELSSPVHSAAVVAGSKAGYARESGARAIKPFALIDSALTAAGVSRESIECIAVGLGPGSYAGVRIAIAIAQGWQIARGVRLLGISSADAVAAQAGQSGATDLWVALDGQRNEIFGARYDASVLEQPRLVEPFRVLTAAERAEAEREHKLWRMDWAMAPGLSSGMASPPDARMIAKLAARRTQFVPAHTLEPVYLRRAEFVKAPPAKFSAD